jgi:ABC-type glycerol-3-phosphate transport system substrate-binding protein
MKTISITFIAAVVLASCGNTTAQQATSIEVDTVQVLQSDTTWYYGEDSVTGEFYPIIEVIQH